jgi:hypothetical protein
MRVFHAAFRVEVFDAKRLLCFAYAVFGYLYGLLLFIDGVVSVNCEALDYLREPLIEAFCVSGRPGNDERRDNQVSAL